MQGKIHESDWRLWFIGFWQFQPMESKLKSEVKAESSMVK